MPSRAENRPSGFELARIGLARASRGELRPVLSAILAHLVGRLPSHFVSTAASPRK